MNSTPQHTADIPLTKSVEGGVTTIHYGDYIHYCRITDATQCSGVATEHMLVYVRSGELTVTENGRSHTLRKGDAYILRRNHMCRKTSRALPDGEPFEGVFFYLTVPMLRRTLSRNAISLAHLQPSPASAYIPLPRHPFLDNLFTSLIAYFSSEHFPGRQLMELKMQETVLTLIEIEPDLTAMLFDFAAPPRPTCADSWSNTTCRSSIWQASHTMRAARSPPSNRSSPTRSTPHPDGGSYAAVWPRLGDAYSRDNAPPRCVPRWDSRA